MTEREKILEESIRAIIAIHRDDKSDFGRGQRNGLLCALDCISALPPEKPAMIAWGVYIGNSNIPDEVHPDKHSAERSARWIPGPSKVKQVSIREVKNG